VVASFQSTFLRGNLGSLGDIGRDPLLPKYSHHIRRRTPLNIGKPLMLALGALLASDPKRTSAGELTSCRVFAFRRRTIED
jgi:hypothetical protein